MNWWVVLILLFVSGGLVNAGQNVLALAQGTTTTDIAITSIVVGFALGLYTWGVTGVQAWNSFGQTGALYSLAIVGLVVLIYLLALKFFYRLSYAIRGLVRRKPQISPQREKLGMFVVAIILLAFFTLGLGAVI